MGMKHVGDAAAWAEETFGSAALGDARRTRRLVGPTGSCSMKIAGPRPDCGVFTIPGWLAQQAWRPAGRPADRRPSVTRGHRVPRGARKRHVSGVLMTP